jgi:nucleotide-binding universal stress UspA family protein
MTRIMQAAILHHCLLPGKNRPLLQTATMRKIIFLSDTEQLPQTIFDYACALNISAPILLVGIFIPRTNYLDTLISFSNSAAVVPIINQLVPEEDMSTSQVAIDQFRELCIKNNIEYRIHEKQGNLLTTELKKETRFADLLLFGNDYFRENSDPDLLYEYTQHIAHHAECPVIILPRTFHQIENIILAYDGSPSAVFAIKQFAHILPDLTQLDTLLICMQPDAGMPDKDYIQELAARHFSSLTFFKADIDHRKHFNRWLEDQQKTLLVTGSFGRGTISDLFRKSFISGILKAHQMPIFVAHQ